MGNKKILYIFSIIYTILAYYINSLNLVPFSIALMVFGILLLVFDLNKGTLFFFISSLVFSDFTFEGTYGLEYGDEGIPLGGIYMASFAGSTLIVFWSLLFLLITFLKKGNIILKFLKKNFFFQLFLIILFFSLIGMVFNISSIAKEAITSSVSDFRIFVNTIVGFSSIILITNSKNDLKKYFNSFLIILLTQLFITLISSYFISNSGIRTVYNFFSGTESYFIGILLLYILMNMSFKNAKILFNNKFIGIISLIVVFLFMFVVAGRGRMIGLIYAFLVYLIFSRKIGYVFVIPFFIILSIYIVDLINPNFYNYFLYKLNSFSVTNESSQSSSVRYISLINIISELLDNPYHFIFGKGFGGYFEANELAFTSDLEKGAFNSRWVAEGKFYKPHGMILYSLLKYGLVMSLLLFYRIGKNSFNKLVVLSNHKNTELKAIAVSLLINIPFVFVTMFSSKLQIMFGMTLAFSQISYNYLIKTE